MSMCLRFSEITSTLKQQTLNYLPAVAEKTASVYVELSFKPAAKNAWLVPPTYF